ncbi:MAG: tail fiber domain-containing protein [Bacteroidales bacterium]
MKTLRRNFRVSGYFVIVALCTFSSIYGQPQSGFTYQAVARDISGSPLSNQSLVIRSMVRSGSSTGTIVWQEDQDVETNRFGLFSLIIGGEAGYNLSGTLTSFGEIDWSNEQYYLNVLLKAENEFQDMGSSPLQMVPLARFAHSAKNAAGNFSVQANQVAEEGEALFEVKRSDGSVAFAVYEDMVWVFVDTSEIKGVKGGFAVGGYNSSKGTQNEFLRITPDSIRMYINTGDTKGVKGGFAVGGYNNSKVSASDFLRISDDSIRMYINESPAKGVKGGFAVGGYNNSKSGTVNFMTLTQDNYFIGQNAGENISSGKYNSVLGYEAAKNLTEGSDNVFIGYQSGYSNTLGLQNVFIGKNAGYNNKGAIQYEPYYLSYGSLNVFIGNNAGFSNDSGWTNLFVGNSAGYHNTIGSDNTYIGNLAGEHNTDGWANTSNGTFSGRANIHGVLNTNVGFYAGNRSESSQNTYIGSYSGEKNVSGNLNTFVGAYSGMNSTGSSNVFIGNGAGSSETGSNKLYIANSSTDPPLIWGDFSMKQLTFNSIVGINGSADPDYALYVHGQAYTTGTWQGSDSRLKTEIEPIENALAKVLKLRGVSYKWNREARTLPGFDEDVHIGLIAQEVHAQIPELVKAGPDGTQSVSYSNLTAVLVEAIKEQQRELHEKEAKIVALEERLIRLERLIGE